MGAEPDDFDPSEKSLLMGGVHYVPASIRPADVAKAHEDVIAKDALTIEAEAISPCFSKWSRCGSAEGS